LHKVDDEFVRKFHAEVLKTGSVVTATRTMQIPQALMREWLNEGESHMEQAYREGREGPGKTAEADLFRAVQSALGAKANDLYAKVEKASKDTPWQAHMKLLEKLDPDEFGSEKQRIEISGPERGAIQVESRGVSIAAVLEFAAQHGALGGARDLDSISETVARARELLPASADDLEATGDLPPAA
jgi:hypothetical protein